MQKVSKGDAKQFIDFIKFDARAIAYGDVKQGREIREYQPMGDSEWYERMSANGITEIWEGPGDEVTHRLIWYKHYVAAYVNFSVGKWAL